MQDSDCFFSIVIPTYNSSGSIKNTLDSIVMQDMYPDEVEILVIDGGSEDNTVEIAKKYGAVVLHNPERVPEKAKAIGFSEAHGRFVIKMDSDEELTSVDQLSLRKRAILSSDAHILMPDVLCSPEEYGFYSKYSTLLGDPFSHFIYRNKGSYSQTYAKYTDHISDGVIHYDFTGGIFPIADGGTTTFDLEYLKKINPEAMKDDRIGSCVSDYIFSNSPYMLIVKNDTIIHNNFMDKKTYLKKLKFRIVNNVFEVEKSGYSSRKVSCGLVGFKKYLFVFYCILILPVLIDSVCLCIRFSDKGFMNHFWMSEYVLFLIGWNVLLKILGIKKNNSSYAK